MVASWESIGMSSATTIRTSNRAPAEQAFALVIGDGILATHLLPESGEVVIGRGSGGGAGIAIDHASISRRHAVLHVGPPLAIEDLGSANGTRVRGTPVGVGARIEITPGEAIELGDVTLVVQRRSAPLQPRRIWPHVYFETRLAEECARSSRSRRGFVVLRLAVREGNDHDAIEHELAAALRASDVIGSYAPGEYEVVLVDTVADDAAPVVRDVIAALGMAGIVATVGQAAYPRDGRDPDALLAAAAPRAPAAAPPHGDALATVTGMQQLRALIERVARSDISVLLLGETGVGKEVAAELLHRSSQRADQPFLRLHCAAISESLLESELFGYERGAFTGAVTAKPGLLETADGGTVLLDEVGELPLAIQVKLLRVLESREVLRVGGLKPKRIDVRFVAATNRDLELEVAAGRFRSDVYYRLNGITLVIPPLRERPDEIEPLARAFAREASRRASGSGACELAPAALALLRDYSWPGNIRELRNVIDRAFVLSSGDEIRVEHLPAEKMRPSGAGAAPRAAGERAADPAALPRDVATLRKELADAERTEILDALDACGGNQSRAARMLGMSRGALLAKLDAYGVPRPRK
jgi:two-component system, NtrC family, response regulator AtoC